MREAHDACFPPFLVCIPPSTKKIFTTILYHFILTLLNAYFDFDVRVANDVAKCTLLRQEVRTLTNRNGRYIMKLNNIAIYLKTNK